MTPAHHPFCDAVENCRNRQDLAHITAVWDRTFLNYTPEFPDRWHDPENEFSEDLQSPEHAVCYLEKLMDHQSGPADTDRIRAYCEFFAAVWRIRFSRKELEIALPFLKKTVSWFPETEYFRILADAVEQKLISPDASADPHRHTLYPSKD